MSKQYTHYYKIFINHIIMQGLFTGTQNNTLNGSNSLYQKVFTIKPCSSYWRILTKIY